MFRFRTTFSGLQGAPYVSTAFFHEGEDAVQDCADALSQFWNAVETVMTSALSWSLDTSVVVMDASDGQLTNVVQVNAASGVGSASGEIAPPAIQGLLRWRTGQYVGGREARGRWFIPGVTETLNVNGRPTAAYRTTVDNAAAAMIGAVGSQLVIWSRTLGSENNVSSWSTWDDWAVLRSRRDS